MEEDQQELPYKECYNAIKQIAFEEGYKDYEFDVHPGSTKDQNYASDLFKIEIKENDNVLHLFIKSVPETIRSDVSVEVLYGREIVAYERVLKKFEEMQSAEMVLCDCRFNMVKCYLASPIAKNEHIVLEDLSAQGFQAIERRERLSFDQVMMVVRAIAKFHALSFAFKKRNPDQFTDLVVLLSDFTEDVATFTEYKTACLDMAAKSVRLAKHRDKLLHAKTLYLNKLQENSINQYSVLTHGDIWKTNIMMKYDEEGKPSDMRLVDYQMMGLGPPAVDLLNFLFTSTEGDIRSGHYNSFLQHYYLTLKRALKCYDIEVKEIFPEEKFYEQMESNAIYGLVAGVAVCKTMSVAEEDVLTLEDVIGGQDVTPPEGPAFKEYIGRVASVVDDCVKHYHIPKSALF